MAEIVTRTDAQWRQMLSEEAYRVTRRHGTERPFTNDNFPKQPGRFRCVCCGADLFDQAHKFESGTGWPSFYAPVAKENVVTETDDSLGARRIEILCRRCGGHLGHVFDDGPRPTGLRYCVNSASLDFEKREK
jgi:peptide-methionine (R)-S-oxide reductase